MFRVFRVGGVEYESSSALTGYGHLQSESLKGWTHRLSHFYSWGGLLDEAHGLNLLEDGTWGGPGQRDTE